MREEEGGGGAISNTTNGVVIKWLEGLELSAAVPKAVSLCPAAAHMCRWFFWTIHHSLHQKRCKVKTKKIRNIQESPFFTVCLNVTFTDNWQNLRT